MSRPWVLSGHAVDRWLERVESGQDRIAAVAALEAVYVRAVRVGTRPDGKAIWAHPDWPLVHFIVATDRPQESPMLVTVAEAGMRSHRVGKGGKWSAHGCVGRRDRGDRRRNGRD